MRTQHRKPALWIVAALVLPLLAAPPALAGKKLVRLYFNGPIVESPVGEMDFSLLMGGEKSRTLRDWCNLIRKAGSDEKIAGAVLIIEDAAAGLAQIDELRRAMTDFRKHGKPIHAYIDYGSNLSYVLACGADDITIAEHSGLDIVGLRAELSFYKGMLDKIGVVADMMHCGAYKSALEPYTRTAPSRENEEMINWLLDGIYARWIQLIADGRNLPPDAVRAAVDAAPLDASAAFRHKLVDHVSSWPLFRERLLQRYGSDVELVKDYSADAGKKIDMSNPFAIFQMINDAISASGEDKKPGVAVIYIEGPIMTGKSTQSFLSGAMVGSTTIRAAVEKAREADYVKAVVVRVDSPGGSAVASDIMWEALTRLGQEKPLIVSMGNVAGSGGYYVAIPGHTIFAEESTLTGSIGVVMGKLITSGLFEGKFGITTHEIKRGANADIMSGNHAWTDAQRQQMVAYMESIYDQFKNRVIASRGARMKLSSASELEPLAGGRVYTGRQAKEKGLVDEIGGLSDAIRFAMGKAGLSEADCAIHVLPKKEGFAEVIQKMMGEPGEDEWEVGCGFDSGVAGSLSGLARVLADSKLAALLPLLRELSPQAAERFGYGLQNLLILDREHVGCFMPFELRFR